MFKKQSQRNISIFRNYEEHHKLGKLSDKIIGWKEDLKGELATLKNITKGKKTHFRTRD